MYRHRSGSNGKSWRLQHEDAGTGSRKTSHDELRSLPPSSSHDQRSSSFSSSSGKGCVLTGFTLGALRHVVDSHPLVEKVHDVIDGSQSEEALHQACESSLTQQSVGSADDTHLPQPADLTARSTCIVCPIRDAQRREFQYKRHRFYQRIAKRGYGAGLARIKLHVQRDTVLEEAYVKLMSVPLIYLQQSHLAVVFTGEEGKDYGGLLREFFTVLSTRLFSPEMGLFEYAASDDNVLQISSASALIDNHLKWFQFAGRVIALALIHRCLLNVNLTHCLYKLLLRRSPTLDDLQDDDPEFVRNIQWLRNNDVSDLGLVFATDEDIFGKVVEHDLKPNGRNRPVTQSNKKGYIKRLVAWRLEQRAAKQTRAFISGFTEMIDTKTLSLFNVDDMKFLISGNPEINVTEWRIHTDYRSDYHDGHPVIGWFWQTVEEYDNEMRLRLLQFVTGTASVPLDGFMALRGSNGARHKFCIDNSGSVDSLPRAHTCFNRLHLPPYESAEILRQKLLYAISETNTFEIA